MPRTKGDRPDVIPDGCVNFAFLGQFAETPRDTIFTTEYSVRTAMEAVYGLLGVDRGVPEVWGSVYDIRDLLDSSVKLMDGKSPLEIELPGPLNLLKKPLLKLVDGNVVGDLLKEHGIIKEDMVKYLHYFEMDINIDLGALSMGQKKKVFMSFALATNTSLLLMDEPTNGLDIPGKSQFRKFIASGMTDDKTILISTHQVRDIDKVLDHVLIMDNSRVLLNESTMSICDKLFFTESENRELLQSSLFSTPSIQGNFLLLPNESGEDSEINLELLFNATLAVPERISALFHSKQIEL